MDDGRVRILTRPFSGPDRIALPSNHISQRFIPRPKVMDENVDAAAPAAAPGLRLPVSMDAVHTF